MLHRTENKRSAGATAGGAAIAGANKWFSGEITPMDKQMGLSAAVAELVDPGDAVHFRRGYEFPFAAAFEVTRQFWGTDPGFTFVCTGASEWCIPAVTDGMIDRLVTTFAGYSYPTPGRSGTLRDAEASGELDIEYWSLYTLIQRLQAGALDVPFVTTNSLAGGSMGEPGKVDTVESPFGDETVRALSPVAPDVSIINGAVADRQGNVLCSPVEVEGNWGVYASDRVVATVERVIDHDTLTEYGHATTIPGHLVDAVVEVPFGSHPRPLYNPTGAGGVQGYHFDREFYRSFREATASEEALRSWTEEWILDVDHESYLQQLGTERLHELASRHGLQSGQLDAVNRTVPTPEVESEPPAPRERMIAWAAETLADRLEDGDFEVVFAGLGVSHMAVWLYQSVQRATGQDATPLLVEAGMYDFTAEYGDTYVFTTPGLPTATLLADSSFSLGAVMGSSRTLSVLSGAQVDRFGNVNSSRIAGEHFIGSGGANDALSLSDEVVLVLEASPKRLVDDVEFVTGPGTNVSRIVTQYGELAEGSEGEFEIDTVYVPPGGERAAVLSSFEDAVGWDVATAETLTETRWTDDMADHVELLRAHDPVGDYRV